jgi:hypothetical protein
MVPDFASLKKQLKVRGEIWAEFAQLSFLPHGTLVTLSLAIQLVQ